MPIRTLSQLAVAVRARRVALGLSQGALAERAGVSRLWINRFEAGKPTAEIGLLLRVLDALELDLEVTQRDATPVPAAETSSSPERVDLDDLLDRYGRP